MEAVININIQLSFTTENIKGQTFEVIEKIGNRTTLNINGRTVDFYNNEVSILKPNKTKLKNYRFEVEYEHKGRLNGFALKETKIKANSYDEAIQKIKKRFKNIFEISEA